MYRGSAGGAATPVMNRWMPAVTKKATEIKEGYVHNLPPVRSKEEVEVSRKSGIGSMTDKLPDVNYEASCARRSICFKVGTTMHECQASNYKALETTLTEAQMAQILYDPISFGMKARPRSVGAPAGNLPETMLCRVKIVSYSNELLVDTGIRLVDKNKNPIVPHSKCHSGVGLSFDPTLPSMPTFALIIPANTPHTVRNEVVYESSLLLSKDRSAADMRRWMLYHPGLMEEGVVDMGDYYLIKRGTILAATVQANHLAYNMNLAPSMMDRTDGNEIHKDNISVPKKFIKALINDIKAMSDISNNVIAATNLTMETLLLVNQKDRATFDACSHLPTGGDARAHAEFAPRGVTVELEIDYFFL
jgi:hypothetical protein